MTDKECKHEWVATGLDSGSTGEAQFVCKCCGEKQFAGGWGSGIHYKKGDKP